MKLLIAEDQRSLREVITQRLVDLKYTVDAVADGLEAIDYLAYATYDVVILDIMMPKKSGWDVLQWMRHEDIQTPVLFLTAKDAVEDRVHGLQMGADDYLIKPFAFDELHARIQVLARRKSLPIQQLLSVADLSLNRQSHEVFRGGELISLTTKEFIILEYLMLHAGSAVHRDTLESISTNYDYEGYSNVVDVFIRYLRKKIDEPFRTKLIHTVRGTGYMIKDSQ